MRGPWDRQDHQKPFAVDFAKPIGAGFYPEDLDEEKLKLYIAENPEDADAVNNLVTMVGRGEGGRLVAQNYSQVSVFLKVYRKKKNHLKSSGFPRPPRASSSADEESCRVDRQWKSSKVFFQENEQKSGFYFQIPPVAKQCFPIGWLLPVRQGLDGPQQ